VKNFLQKEAVKYPAVSVLYTHGDPVAIFYGEEDQEVERVGLSKFNEAEIHELLQSRGLFPNDTPALVENNPQEPQPIR